MNIFIIALLVLACTIAGFIVFAGLLELYFSRKEKYFLKQVQTIGAVLGTAADGMLKQINIQKKEESK